MENHEGLPPAKNFRVTGRDIELLKLLHEYGCVDSQRIKAKLWNGNLKSRAHFRRLSILKKLRLIDNVVGDQGVGLGYRITAQGVKVLETKGEAVLRLYPRRRYKTQFEHDQLLIDIRRILEKSSVIKDFKTDQQVRAEIFKGHIGPTDWKNAPTIPDGTFIYEVPGQKLKVALELELSLKSQARYFKIFRSHLLNRDWQMTFYIVRDPQMSEKLMETLAFVKREDATISQASRINGLYICALDEFQKLELDTPFTNGKQVIRISELEKLALCK